MSRQPFLLMPRKTKDGSVWYYKLPDETCYHTTHIQHTRKADRDVAAAWMLDLIAGHPAASSRADPALEAYARDFYRWPDASYVKRQLAKKRPFGKSHADILQGYLVNWIFPTFGRRALSSLTKKEIEDWLISLPLANSTKNHILYAFRALLQDAVDDGKLEKCPLDRVEALGQTRETRDVFSVAEYRVLFPIGDLAAVWGSQRKGLFFLTLAGTGIRSGECRALSWRQILWAEKALLIDRACEGGTLKIGPVSEKKGGAKIVLMPSLVTNELQAWRELSVWRRSEDLVFPGKARGIPISAATITKSLPSAFRRLDKAAKEKQLPPPIDRSGRNLVVHSFRHTFVSRLRRLVPEDVLRSLTGHHSEAMTNLYDHPDRVALISALGPAREAVDGILKGEI
jgi:integrase